MKEVQKFVSQQLENDDKFLYKALLRMYDRQTEEEQKIKKTTEKNSQGFYPRDAGFLSSVAVVVSVTGSITNEELKQEARRRLSKYTKQLSEVMASDIALELFTDNYV